MPSICFYFQVHQPYRLRRFHVFDIGQGDKPQYFDEKKNREICRKVADKCYIPTNRLMLKLIKRHKGYFKISYSISGVALEQFATYTPDVLESFQELVETGQVEILSETYFHSLASLFNPAEFKMQVNLHKQAVKKYFHKVPKVFRNTELIYSDAIAQLVAEAGFKGMIMEGADRVLGWQSPNFVYQSTSTPPLALLLKNYTLSDDIAFRFSEKAWKEWPLTTEKFSQWVHALDGNAETVNLFMDYETFGEHQWESTGIFKFMEALPDAVQKHHRFDFATPSEVIKKYPVRNSLSVPYPVSWADAERDTSAWLGNPMQDSTIAWVYALENEIRKSKDPHLLDTWRKLQTSDHFYYMCTKFWSDGDVHKYFSAFDSPHQSYTIMNNVLTDLQMRLEELAVTK